LEPRVGVPTPWLGEPSFGECGSDPCRSRFKWKRLLKLLRPAVDVESRAPPLANGGVGGGASSERPLLEPKVEDRVRPLIATGGSNAGEEPDDCAEWTELFLSKEPPGAAKDTDAAARVAEVLRCGRPNG
jgi:hypothetical protein